MPATGAASSECVLSATAPSLRHRLIPRNFHDPFGLFLRLLRTKDRAAYFAMASTVLAALALPFDRLLEFEEMRRYAAAPSPSRPILLVAGAPRSGTTVIEQALAHHLPVTYFNNLTAVFPRSPIVANLLFGGFLKAQPTYQNFYGRTVGFAQPNDALYLWERWLGLDRYAVPDRLTPAAATSLRQFFGAYEAAFDRPLLSKNNALASCADAIGEALPTAHFLIAWREPAYTVQSILGARRTIQGDAHLPYGVGAPGFRLRPALDPVEEVCAQVLYHQRRMAEQQQVLGTRRLQVVNYENFCAAPYELVARVGREILGLSPDMDRLRAALPSFGCRNRVHDPREFDQIVATLDRLGANVPTPAVSA